MKAFVKQAIQILEQNGYKITTPRKQVLELIQKASSPLSPYDLQKMLSKEEALNPVTIYRVLELFVKLHLVHKVASGGFVKCSIPTEEGCHHFVVCNSCGTTKEFAEDQGCHFHLPTSIAKDFTVTSHTYEIAGICKKCKK
jgi:Fur family zinc uptake transcriptional regulator